MALIVEDGSVVAGADSYVSLSDARALATRYGLELPEDDTAAEIALRNGAVYVGLQEVAMCGRRVSPYQTLAFPRTGIWLYGFSVAANSVPASVLQAQVIAAAEYGAGTDVRGSTDGRATASERVEGAVTVTYFDTGSTGATTTITAALDALRPLLCGASGGSSFRVMRG